MASVLAAPDLEAVVFVASVFAESLVVAAGFEAAALGAAALGAADFGAAALGVAAFGAAALGAAALGAALSAAGGVAGASLDTLQSVMTDIRKRYPQNADVLVVPADDVAYDDLIHVLERLRIASFSGISLGNRARATQVAAIEGHPTGAAR